LQLYISEPLKQIYAQSHGSSNYLWKCYDHLTCSLLLICTCLTTSVSKLVLIAWLTILCLQSPWCNIHHSKTKANQINPDSANPAQTGANQQKQVFGSIINILIEDMTIQETPIQLRHLISSLTTCYTLLIGKLITSVLQPNGHAEHQKHSKLILYLQRDAHTSVGQLAPHHTLVHQSHWYLAEDIQLADERTNNYCIILLLSGCAINPSSLPQPARIKKYKSWSKPQKL